MAYFPQISSSITQLVDANSHLFYPDTPFGKDVWCVIQNRNLEHWLKLHLAERCGTIAAVRFITPDQAVRRLVKLWQGEAEKHIVFRDELQLALYFYLRQHPAGPGLEDGDSSQIRHLAMVLGAIFDRYAGNMPAMLDAWATDSFFFEPGDARRNIEAWQRPVWNGLFGHSPLTSIWHEVRKLQHTGEPFPEAERLRVILFGSAFLSQTFIDFFSHMAAWVDVHHLMIGPAKGDADQESLHPLVQRWGKLSIEQTRQVYHSARIFNRAPVVHSTSSKPPTVLAQFQKSLTNPPAQDSDPGAVQVDDSLGFVSAPGRLRELEILKDLLLAELENKADLKLTDIVILAPDINEYAGLIDVVFTGRGDNQRLPYSIADLDYRSSSAYIQGLLDILGLARSRFGRSEILRLVQNSCVAERFTFDGEDFGRLQKMFEELNIQWGIGPDEKQAQGLGSNWQSTWRHGLDRVAAGWFFEEGDNPLALGDGLVIPHSMPDSDLRETAGRFLVFFDQLLELNRTLREDQKTTAEWVAYIREVAHAFLQVRDDRPAQGADQNRLMRILASLAASATSLNLDEAISFESFYHFLSGGLESSAAQRGAYLTGGITFSSLKPLRTIPFRQIYMLGMDEDSFPAKTSSAHFDLLANYTGSATGIRRNWDKFSFLEAIMSAEDKVTIFFTGRDNVTGAAKEPSVLVKELWAELWPGTAFGSIKDAMLEHRLHGWDSAYFIGGDSALFSYHQGRAAAAQASFKNQPIPKRSRDRLGYQRAYGDKLEITLADLTWFVRNPARTFFRNRLNLSLPEQNFQNEDQEVFEMPVYKRRMFLNDFLPTGRDIDASVDDAVYRSQVNAGILDFNAKDYLRTWGRRLSNFKEELGLGAGRRAVRLVMQADSPRNDEILHLPPIPLQLQFAAPFEADIADLFEFDGHLVKIVFAADAAGLSEVMRDTWLEYLALAANPEARRRYESFRIYALGEDLKKQLTFPLASGFDNGAASFHKVIDAYQQNLEAIILCPPQVGKEMAGVDPKQAKYKYPWKVRNYFSNFGGPPPGKVKRLFYLAYPQFAAGLDIKDLPPDSWERCRDLVDYVYRPVSQFSRS